MIDPEDAPSLLAKLEQLCSTLGVSVRYEALGDGEVLPAAESGLCRLRKDRILFVDARLPPVERCRVLASELRRFDLTAVFLHPVLRRLLEGAGNEDTW